MLCLRHGLVICFLLPMLQSCALGPDFHSPPPPLTERYSDVPLPAQTAHTQAPGENAQAFLIGNPIPAQWWMLFHSEGLNQLICKGFERSPTLKAAQGALQQAQENLNVQVGNLLFPAVDLQSFAQRQQFSLDELGFSRPPSRIFNLYNTQVNVSYTFDLFGANRRAIEASCAFVENQRFELEATYLTLASNIVTTAITEAQLREQVKITQEIITLEQTLLDTITKQFELGAIAKADVLAQENQIATTRATLPPLEKRLSKTRNALAVLIGEYPSENQLPVFCLNDLQLPATLPLSLPSEMVRQRPDIRAAEALLHQASAQIGVATANLLPKFTITGYYGWESNFANRLFTPDANIWSIMGQAVQPLFHGGALLAQRRAALVAYDIALAQYYQTVLLGFQNVADALRAIELDAQTLQAQAEVEKSAEDLFKLTKQQYTLGATTYLSLLNAERQYQQARINRVQAKADRYTDTAALFQALGGGWWMNT